MARFLDAATEADSATLWIVSLLLLVYTTLTLLVRLWVRIKMMGSDDAAVVLAQFLAYGNIISIMLATRKGTSSEAKVLSRMDRSDVAKVGCHRVLLCGHRARADNYSSFEQVRPATS